MYFQTADSTDLVHRQDSPVLLDESLNLRSTKLGNLRYAGEKGDKGPRSATKRALKDPAMPKRPGSAYFFFCEQEREHLRVEFEAAHPGAPTTEFTKHLVEKWKHLPADQKAPFLKNHEDDKRRYAAEMEVYNEKKAEETGEVNEANDGNEEVREDANGAGEDENDDTVDAQTSSRQPMEALEESSASAAVAPEVKKEPAELAEPSESKEETASSENLEPKKGGMSEPPINSTGNTSSRTSEGKSSESTTEVLPADKTEEPPAKRAKVEATRTISLGANGQHKFTIKIKSPTMPHP